VAGNPITSISKSTLNAMGQGAKSALASTLTGGTGGITKALDTLSSVKMPSLPGLPDIDLAGKFDPDLGAAASSFKSITATFKPFKAGVPQDLGAIAEKIAGDVTAASEGVTGEDLASLSVNTSIAENAIAGAKDKVASLAGSVTSLANTGGLAKAASIVSKGASATTAAVVASGVSNLPGGQKIAGSVVDNAKGVSNAVADGLSSVTATVGGLAASAFSGKDPGAGIKDLLGAAGSKLGGLTSSLSSALSPGAAAALVSALASLTSGGGSSLKLPTVANNTFGTRLSLSSLVSTVLGNPKIPRPNLLGEISTGALSAFKSLKSLKATLAEKTKAVTSEEKKIASKQAKYAEILSILPSGSPEIEKAKQEYESALNSPAYKNAILEAKAVTAEIGKGITPAVQVPKTTNQFSELEELITTTAENEASQALNNESNSNASVELTQLVDLTDMFNPILDDGLNTYSVVTQEEVVVPGGEAVVDNTVEAVTGEDPNPRDDGVGNDRTIGNSGSGGCPDPNARIDTTPCRWILACDLRVGTTIYTMHELTQEWGYFKVESLRRSIQPKLTFIFANKTQTTVSASHKFFDGKEFVVAGKLTIGDTVVNRDMESIVISDILAIGEGEVIHIEVKDARTYIADNMFAHNKNLSADNIFRPNLYKLK
tara:strand:+ start:521 stop:2497 length:1977 start_codon:yes stop_codon:yes gene_type:complete